MQNQRDRLGPVRIGVVAPSTRIDLAVADRVLKLAGDAFQGRVELVIHKHCFLSWGHFAGTDAERAAAVLDYANDPRFDAIWFARGGYGANRIAEAVLAGLGPAARTKTYLGYSDAGFLLAGLYRSGVGRPVHGPMLNDVKREGGDAAVLRALSYLAGEGAELEPNPAKAPRAAFNLTVLSQLLGTPLEPDLSGHELLVEEVSEELYRIDRTFFHLTASPNVRRITGLRLGRVSDVKPNDPEFGQTEEEIARFWCARAGISYLGRADIGHDADNKIVPFGRASPN